LGICQVGIKIGTPFQFLKYVFCPIFFFYQVQGFTLTVAVCQITRMAVRQLLPEGDFYLLGL
jgi:hypothetical protein